MPHRIATRHTHAVAFLAIAALLVQTIVAGWATINSAAAHAGEIGVICHGESRAAPSDTPAPSKSCELCCICCTSAALATVNVPSVSRLAPQPIADVALPHHLFVTVRVGAVRAGQSQAPPSFS